MEKAKKEVFREAKKKAKRAIKNKTIKKKSPTIIDWAEVSSPPNGKWIPELSGTEGEVYVNEGKVWFYQGTYMEWDKFREWQRSLRDR